MPLDAAVLRARIQPLAEATYACDVMLGSLADTLTRYAEDYGGVERIPDFQRGHVWTPAQQQAFIEGMLRRSVPQALLTIQWNCPNFGVRSPTTRDLPDGFQCLDGLQRLTAVERWLAGDVRPCGLTLADLAGSAFAPTRLQFHLRFAVFTFQHRAEVLQHYLAINAGGTVHTAQELDRVRGMLATATPVATS